MMETEHLQVFFDQELTVKFKFSDKDERRLSRAHLSIGWITRPGLRNKVLSVQLTEDTDVFFLYNLEISDEEFYYLKQDQGLLVDFNSFPMKFIELLNLCLAGEKDANPKFLLQLSSEKNGKSAVLSIVETNPFKYLTHLSLNLTSGNDVSIKKYLANVIRALKEHIANLKDQLSNLQYHFDTRLQDATMALEKAHSEIERQKMEFHDELEKIKEKSTAEYSELRSRGIFEREELVYRFEQDLKKSQDHIRYLEAQNKVMTDKALQSDESLGTLNWSIQEKDKELGRTLRELERVQVSFKEIELTKLESEREMNAYRVTATNLEQQLREKNDEFQRTMDSLVLTQEQKKKMEETLELYRSQNAKLEEALKKSKDEITKGNEIIQKLQNEYRDIKTKFKLKHVLNSQQEKSLEDRQRMIDTLSREVEDLRRQMTLKDQELEHLNTQIKLSTKKLDESKQIIETNENVISWLNKQVNEKLTLSTSEFEKYGGGGKQPTPTSSENSGDLNKQPYGGSSVGTQKLIYKPTSALQQETRLESIPSPLVASSEPSVALGSHTNLNLKLADETKSSNRYPLKSVSQLSKPSSYF